MLGARRKWSRQALDEHVSDPQNSSILASSIHPSLNDKGLVEFLCNSLASDR